MTSASPIAERFYRENWYKKVSEQAFGKSMDERKEGNGSWPAFTPCMRCTIRELVLFADLHNEDFGAIHVPIEDVTVPVGEALYQPGQAAAALFTIRDGLLKLEQYLPDGSRRIVSLLGQGDVAGIEATVADTYEHAAIALQRVRACRIPKEVVAQLSPKLHRQMMNKWHDALRKSHDCTRELSTGTARQRLARLFLFLAPNEATECRLFSRDDVGALLGITPETASRLVAEFKRSGIVTEIEMNRFRRDCAALERIAAGEDVIIPRISTSD